MRCSRKWGPIDTILRFNWVQWHSKAKNGERDFTLKRRGTKDYAHSVKKRSKRSYAPALSDISTTTETMSYKQQDPNQNTFKEVTNYKEPFYFTTKFINDERPLRITSLINTLDSPVSSNYRNASSYPSSKSNLNPMANLKQDLSEEEDSYGTFRKGPYIIANGNSDHVCHRKISEDATEL